MEGLKDGQKAREGRTRGSRAGLAKAEDLHWRSTSRAFPCGLHYCHD